MTTRPRPEAEPNVGEQTESTTATGAQAVALSQAIDSAPRTILRGLRLSPEFTRGLWLTVLLALCATAGKVVVPVAVQQVIDVGIVEASATATQPQPDIRFVTIAVAACAVSVVVTAACTYAMNVRLYRATESGLASLRIRAFRHVHDLATLTQNSERKGALVSRVTADIDQISNFMQWGGILLIVSSGQLLISTGLMAYYSWQLTLVVWVCFLPLFLAVRALQRWLSRAYLRVRERTGDMLAAISEAVLGAAVIKVHASEDRTTRRISDTVHATRRAQTRAHRLGVTVSPLAELVAATASAAVVVLGVLLGVAGSVTAGQLVAFLFLLTLFVTPMVMATEVLNQAQDAIAGWRRVLAVLDTPPDVADPGPHGTRLPQGAISVHADHLTYAYPGGEAVVQDVCLTIPAGHRIAIVGETGSGKSTLVKLLTRLMDPTSGTVRLNGVDLRSIAFSSLRRRVVLVPQEGFLFEGSLADNLRFAHPDASTTELTEAIAELGLSEWVATLPDGVDTQLGQRGEFLSAGERQLAALIRAHLAGADLLVLDEATSAVDPATETRLQQAFDRLTRKRTAVTIAHRMSTAEAADEVVVLDGGRVVQRGPHAELVAAPGPYADLYASWVRGTA
ncbi:ABC transporter ATP-binding protein [Lipingzhangella sp. LS1_29]|uniref:ABC transporter ATP-binding protein n=1 Tax=Lipingzhangella rawalii TaxID=2055835 RepID=A0ABU2H219_9ACTN|nr:ABC transporter ATP-binding protein [Lipingzhangella rawalii]MDS1269353.1 ABC transporter ATP-binding protein [Lipingzhangella rawalii]